MKLELTIKELAPYLPYGLKINAELSDINYNIMTMCDKGGLSNILISDVIDDYECLKPILRPLSDLTKEDFNYIHTLLRVHIGKNKRDKLIKDSYGILDLPYFIVEQLIENHFDVFGLIEKGLAIDINKLNQ